MFAPVGRVFRVWSHPGYYTYDRSRSRVRKTCVDLRKRAANPSGACENATLRYYTPIPRPPDPDSGTTCVRMSQPSVPPGPLPRRTYVRWWGGRLRTHVPNGPEQLFPNECSHANACSTLHAKNPYGIRVFAPCLL